VGLSGCRFDLSGAAPKGFCKSPEFAFNPAHNSDKTTGLHMPGGRHLAPGLGKVYASFFELKGFGICDAFLRGELTPKLAVKKKLISLDRVGRLPSKTTDTGRVLGGISEAT